MKFPRRLFIFYAQSKKFSNAELDIDIAKHDTFLIPNENDKTV